MNEMNKIIVCKVLAFLILLGGLWLKGAQVVSQPLIIYLFFMTGFSLMAYSWYLFYKAKKRRDNNQQENNN
jgi:hypothetical protein